MTATKTIGSSMIPDGSLSGFEITGTIGSSMRPVGSLILIFTNTQNRQFFDS
jgi:hypothetical protein